MPLPLCSRQLPVPSAVGPCIPLRWHFPCQAPFFCRPRGLQEMREVKECAFTEGPHDLVHLAFPLFSLSVGDPYLLFHTLSSA